LTKIRKIGRLIEPVRLFCVNYYKRREYRMKQYVSLVLCVGLTLASAFPNLSFANNSDDAMLSPRTKTVLSDTAIGAAVGAGVGVVANQKNGRSAWKNAGVGAAVGAAGGAIIGIFRTRNQTNRNN
jgi:hypothetical protein